VNQAADALMGIFGFKRQTKGTEMEKTKKEIMLERFAAGREKARLNPKPKVDKPKLPSLRKAINDHCKSCGYDPSNGGGTWKQQISACTAVRCFLHPVRPQSKVSFASKMLSPLADHG